MNWVILTGEYPPQTGGVSDYTFLVSRGLAAAGDAVEVWAPASAETAPAVAGVTVHRLPGRFDLRSLRQLDVALSRRPDPFRLLVQYVPHAFGTRGMNLPFAAWVWSQRHAPVSVMFHEAVFPWNWRQPLRHQLVGLTTRVMAYLISRRADRLYVSIPAWKEVLMRLTGRAHRAVWLPVPSTLPTRVDPAAVANARAANSVDSSTQLVGHFGTYGVHVSGELRRVLPAILRAHSSRVGVLMGRDSEQFAASLVHAHPCLASRIRAFGYLAPDEAAAQIAACDLLVQPYPDGVSTRRTSVMAGLALGRPIVTTTGVLTEGVWRESQAVALVPAENPAAFIDAAESLLTSMQEREAYGLRARAFYAANFALDQTICRLRAESLQLETPRCAPVGAAACS